MTAWLVGARPAGMVKDTQHITNDAPKKHPCTRGSRAAFPITCLPADNRYWPALYFADAQGRIRYHRFGEGDYQQSEMVIQQLLAEAGTTDHDHELVSVETLGAGPPARPGLASCIPGANRTPAPGFTLKHSYWSIALTIALSVL